MGHAGEVFAPRRKINLEGTTLKRFVSRHLTPISIGVALIGMVLVIAGPVRTAWVNHPPASTSGEASSGGQGQGGLSGLSNVGELSLAAFIRQPLAFTIIPDRPRSSITVYTVKPGDTLFGIAGKFKIDPKTIFWSNAVLEDNVHMLQPGMELAIPPVDGVYYAADGEHTLAWAATQYKVDVNTILTSQYNELAGYTADQVPPWGMKILVPGGERDMIIRPVVVTTTDARTGKTVTGFMPGMGGSCPAGMIGTGGTGAWVNPMDSYIITQYYHAGHNGVDLGAPVGTPVYAADSGMVIFSGWNDWGYGILVVLDHGNGWTTYYGHLNSRSVGCGDVVSRGQYIGGVGSTGNSSGAHLHFEMRWGHTPDNPASYIGF